jgi:hypothetical protein
VVALVVVDQHGKQGHIFKRGLRCPGEIVGADLRPGRKTRSVSYMEIRASGIDERTVAFEGWSRTYVLLPTGEIRAEIGKGCGADLSGRVRSVPAGWRMVGQRNEGCAE